MTELCYNVQVAVTAGAERVAVVDGWHSQSTPRSLRKSCHRELLQADAKTKHSF